MGTTDLEIKNVVVMPSANANGPGWPFSGSASGGWCHDCQSWMTYPHTHYVNIYPTFTHYHDWQVVTFNGLGYVACKTCTVVTKLPT